MKRIRLLESMICSNLLTIFTYVLYKGDAIFIQRFDKKTGELKSQRIPDDYLECSAAIPGGNVIGMDNDIDGGIPFWPEYVMADGGRAQVGEC